MQCFEVTGGTALTGRVRVTGAKNSALKLMAAALLAPGRTTIDEVPDILDVAIMSEVLRRLGCGVDYQRTRDGGGGGRVLIDVPLSLGALATRKPCSLWIEAPSRSRPEMCMSSPREPMASPPGSATRALPQRATSGPRTLIEARILRTRS